ncbi:MAG: hypothetical protein NZ742_04630 [Acidobacteria bacterium]|nr:hypothetical protein [Acidobacteriota bacterium]MDW7983523.1 hypothetical protein [Acidobacteriota bacterium]
MRVRAPTAGPTHAWSRGDVSRFHRVVTYLIVNVQGAVLQIVNRWDIVPMGCRGGKCCV